MDRFIALDFNLFAKLGINLKSSMDRFIVDGQIREIDEDFDLKSSMDRFIGSVISYIVSPTLQFKIQYG